MIKVVGYTALHYGCDYLSYAIRSVINTVSEFHVLYTDKPSHGSRSDAVCPDSEQELHELAWQAAGSKLRWHYGTWLHEGEQRNSIYDYAPNADVIICVDSDEIYANDLSEDVIPYGLATGCRYMRLPFIHAWRSFKRGFAHDPAYPERVYFPKQYGATVTMPTDKRVHHFGYAQRSEVVRYKMLAHGHLNEFRHDCDWFNDVFMANRQYDCHPVGSEFWNVEPLEACELPGVLHNHPYKNLELIP